MVEDWGIIEERERSGGRMGENGRKRKEWWKNGGKWKKEEGVVEEWGLIEKKINEWWKNGR